MDPIIHVRMDPEDLGASLARLDNYQQAAALRSFCRELRSACGNNHLTGLQLRFAAEELSHDDRQLLSLLGDD